MILAQLKEDVFKSGLRHIVAGIPVENANRRYGIGSAFIRNGWRDLCNQSAELGDVLIKEIDGVQFYAVACYKWGVGGWDRAPQIIGKALSDIRTMAGAQDIIGLVPPGYNQGQEYGADWLKIREAINVSTTRVKLYTLG